MREPWQAELLEGPSAVKEVAALLGLSAERVARLEEASAAHGFRTTRHYLSLVDPSDPADPILAQLLPSEAELAPSPAGYSLDAVGDVRPENHPAPGLIHKYAGRALLVTTSACAVNCRYCFRRAFPYEELRDGGPRMQAAREAIAADSTIHEVILSGGDPLSWTDRALAALVDDLAAIPHLRRLRVHTRMPVVLPARITPALLAVLRGSRLQPWVVTHFNHPRELDPAASAACRAIVEAGIPLLNQSVLLAGVNDDEDTLEALCSGLVDLGVKPYYLHQLDRVHGIAHFEVEQERGARIVAGLRARLSGIAMPTWVRDLPGAASKTPLFGLLLALLVGCGGEQAPPKLERTLRGVPAQSTPAAPPAPVPTPAPVDEGPEDIDAPMGASAGATEPPAVALPLAERVLVADLFGDGSPEVFIAADGDVRWGEWPAGASQPRWSGRHVGSGMLQAWFATDLDGDGNDEVVMAFGLGRGFPDAQLDVVLLDAPAPGQTVARTLRRSKGERNQATALARWPRADGTADVYLAAFVTRFDVSGSVIDRSTGAATVLPGHTVRMGMARAVADFDGDGAVEVAIGRLYGDGPDTDGDLRLLQEDGTTEIIPTRRGVRAVGAGDLDGNRVAELLFGDSWHKAYGSKARFRPRIARRARDGTWTITDIDERADNYAVEQIGVVGRAVVAGGNATARVYVPQRDGSWSAVGGPEPVKGAGSWAALPTGELVLSGDVVRRVLPGTAGSSGDVAPGEQQEGEGQQKP